MANLRVLLLGVADEAARLTAGLGSAGFEVKPAANLDEVLLLAKQGEGDLVLGDLRANGIDGKHLVRMIREAEPELPVVLVASANTDEELKRGFQCGAYAILRKPIAVDRAVQVLLRAAQRPSVLLVDDTEAVVESTAKFLRRAGLRVRTTTTGEMALKLIGKGGIDVCVTDLVMPGLDGAELVERIHSINPAVFTIAVSGYDVPHMTHKAGAKGAYRYLRKPVEPLILIETITEARSEPKPPTADGLVYFDIVGQSPPMREVFALIDRVSGLESSVLLRGETGTGKELVARAIHAAGPRSHKLFVPLDLAAVPESLVESEMFGHEVGAFTGALHEYRGKVETAEGGTLFIDEVGDLPLATQLKLLRVLQERTFTRLGSTQSRRADFRLICATRRDLSALVKQHQFRDDLYYRIDVVRIDLPPLRDRGEDIILLAEYFLEHFAQRNHMKRLSLGQAAINELLTHPWPGNVRELEHTIERAVATHSAGHVIDAGLVMPRPPRRAFRTLVENVMAGERGLSMVMDELERAVLLEALRRYEGNQTMIAKKLRIPRTTLRSRLEKHGLVEEAGPEEGPPDEGKTEPGH